MSAKKEVRTIIAKAIKSADSSWFNEDYSKQAAEVVRELGRAGYAIVPKEPDADLTETGVEALQAGRHRPEDIIKAVYQAMVKKGKI